VLSTSVNKRTGTASIEESVQTLMNMKEAWKPSPVVMRSLDLIAGSVYLLSYILANNFVSYLPM
jgi:hypothetical protein